MAGTTIGGEHFLKLTLLNPETTRADLEHVLELIAGHAAEHVARHPGAALAGSVR